MNLYGSYANVSAVKRLLERLGHSVTVETVNPGDNASLSDADFLFMGAGTERRQVFALGDFARLGGDVKALAADGGVMLFAGTAMELLGASITDAAGATRPGIGLADFTAVQGKQRFVEDVYGHTDLFSEPIVGFMNKCAKISGVTTPLLTGLDMGFGNEVEKGPEGFRRGNVFASELTGPILVKNPRLLLCDELTGALDTRSSKNVLRFVEKMNRKYGTTVVIITHNEAIAKMADQIIRIRDGRVEESVFNEKKIPAEELEL